MSLPQADGDDGYTHTHFEVSGWLWHIRAGEALCPVILNGTPSGLVFIRSPDAMRMVSDEGETEWLTLASEPE